jgi:hypothetical protein
MERMQKTMWTPADRDALQVLLTRMAALPSDQRIGPVQAWVDKNGGIDAALERLHADPALAEVAPRLALLDQDRAAHVASTDPWMELAIALDQHLAPQRERDRARAGAQLRLQPIYFEALRAVREGELYPDANGTLRITVGHVKGYSPQDGLVALPQTTLAGMVAKAGPDPFDVPQSALDAAATASQSRWVDPALGDLPVNFLTTLDTTGGNSGSATLDAQGRLVGLIFDGNYEAMSADWVFDDNLTRSIHMDVRYMLWILEDVAHADWILDELGVAAP